MSGAGSDARQSILQSRSVLPDSTPSPVQGCSTAGGAGSAGIVQAGSGADGGVIPGMPDAPNPMTSHWVEVMLVDDEDRPVGGVAWKIVGNDGVEYGGTLDDTGMVRVEGLDATQVTISFPDLDRRAWQPA